jgi:hypothetical protein
VSGIKQGSLDLLHPASDEKNLHPRHFFQIYGPPDRGD